MSSALLNSARSVTRAPADSSGPKVISPRMILFVGRVAIRGILAVEIGRSLGEKRGKRVFVESKLVSKQ